MNVSNSCNQHAILPSVKIDADAMLAEYFLPHQIAWILGEEELHARKKQI